MAGLSVRRAGMVLFFFTALLVLAGLYVRNVPLRSSLFDLLPPKDPLVQRYKEVEGFLSPTDFVVVLLRLVNPPPDKEERERILFSAAERLIQELRDPEIRRVSYRLGEEVVVPDELLLFYQLDQKSAARLREIADRFTALLPPGGLPSVPRERETVLADAFREVREALESTKETGEDLDLRTLSQQAQELETYIQGALEAVGFLERLPQVLELLDEAAGIIQEVLSRPPPKPQPLISPDRTRLLVQIWPRRPSYAGTAYCRRITSIVEEAVARARLGELGVEAGITGSYVAVAQGDELIRQDLSRTTLISGIGVFVLLALALGSVWGMLASLIPLVFSSVFTVAWAKFSVDGFNLITVFLPALVLGLGVDYALHLVSRFLEERREGRDFLEAVSVAVRSKGMASLGAALTTALAFSCLLPSRSRGMEEMGVIMSVGIIVSFFTTILMIPALLSLIRRLGWDRVDFRGIAYERRLEHPYWLLLSKRWAILFLTIALTLGVLYQASHVRFVFVSQNLAPRTPAQRVAQEAIKLFSSEISFSDDFLFFVPREELAKVQAELARNPAVKGVRSIRDLLPGELLRGRVSFQEIPLAPLEGAIRILGENIPRWEETQNEGRKLAVVLSQWELLSALAGAERTAEALSSSIDGLLQLVQDMARYSPEELRGEWERLRNDYRVISRFLERLSSLPPEPELLDELVAVLPGDLRAYYRTPDGKYVIHVQLVPTYLEEQRLREFIHWLKQEKLDYFGFPEVNLALKHYMERDFYISTSLAGILILLILFLNFRSFYLGLVAMVPLLVGYVWMLAGMRVMGIDFNFINIAISPLLIGLGVDSGIHICHRILEEGREPRRAAAGAASVAVPVVSSAFTTMVVFGSLLFANTPGLRILGICALLGLGFSLLASLLFLPAALVKVERH